MSSLLTGPIDLTGQLLGSAASSIAGDAVTMLAKAILGALAHVVQWCSTLWLQTPTPQLADASGQATGTAAWLQVELGPFVAVLAVASVLVGAGRIAIVEHKGAATRELGGYLVAFVAVSSAGVAVAALLVAGCDQIAGSIIAQGTAGQNFGDELAHSLGLVTQAASASSGAGTGFLTGLAATTTSAFLAIILGLVALIGTFVEFLLMTLRGGVLVVLCGLLPLAVAATNVPTGERWLRRIGGWIVALALYKPAAAVLYAAAFKLSSGTTGTGFAQVVDGLALLVVSIAALPALLRLVMPAAENVATHRGAVAGVAAAALTMPTGAAPLAAAGPLTTALPSTGAGAAAGGASAATGASGAAAAGGPLGGGGAPGTGVTGITGNAGPPNAGGGERAGPSSSPGQPPPGAPPAVPRGAGSPPGPASAPPTPPGAGGPTNPWHPAGDDNDNNNGAPRGAND